MVGAVGAFGHLQLAQDHCACVPEACDDGGVFGGHVGAMDHHAGGRGDARGVAEIFYGNRHAMEGAARFARSGLGIEAGGVRERPLGRERRVAPELAIYLADAIKDRPRCFS